jgi:hypothetical protein
MRHFTFEAFAIQDKAKFSTVHSAFEIAVSEIKESGKLSTRTLAMLEQRVSDQMTELFNLNTLVLLGANAGEAYCVVQPINARHIFTPVEYKRLLDGKEYNMNNASTDALLESGREGGIDLSTGRVTGIFSEIETYVYIDVLSLFNKGINTAGNLVSILLHEIGHILTYVLYCANTASVNQLLMLYAKEAIDPSTFTRKLQYSYVKPTPAVQKVIKNLTGTSSRLIFNWEVSKLLYEHHATHSTHSIYDNSSAESLADNFTARCGYGGELIDALVKLHMTNRIKTITGVYTDNLATSSFHIYKSLFRSNKQGISQNAVLIIISAILYAIYVIYLVLLHIGAMQDGQAVAEGVLRYDSLYRRALRVREQVVHNLRFKRDPKVLALILDELDTIDKFMPDKSLWDKFGPVARWVESKLTSDEKNQITFEQSLSAIINNPLLISSANALVKLERKL